MAIIKFNSLKDFCETQKDRFPTKPILQPVAPLEKVEDRLTDEQLNNWRTILYRVLGPYTGLLEDEEIQSIRNNMNNHFKDGSYNE